MGRLLMLLRNKGAAASTLATLRNDVVFEIDLTVDAGGNTVSNIIESPADGELQTAYDFYLGAAATTDGDEPTFSTDGYVVDGGDYMQIAGGNTTFIDSLHQTDAVYTIIMCYKQAGTVGNASILRTGESNPDEGIAFLLNTSGNMISRQYDGVSANTQSDSGVAPQTINEDYCLIYSVSISGGTESRHLWVNSSTKKVDSGVWGNYENGLSGSATDALRLMRYATTNAGNGLKFYTFAMTNTFIEDDSDAGAIIDYYETLHGRSYD